MRAFGLVLVIAGACAPAASPGTPPADTDVAVPTAGLDGRPSNATCVASLRAPAVDSAGRLVRLWPELSLADSTVLVHPPGSDAWWLLGTRPGVVHRLDGATGVASVALDLSALTTSSGSEQGLLGVAFHPRFADNGFVYVHHTGTRGIGQTVLARYTLSADGRTADPASRAVLLEVDQPFRNHNGGDVQFGPDGMLYLALGDGGSARDPRDNGQNPDTLLGAILRLDVDGGTPYAIPADNPFAAGEGGAPEVYAWGLRNPYRMAFDGDSLWVGDVGQNRWEEISLVPRGGNLGWRVAEGPDCLDAPCDLSGFVPPVWAYPHTGAPRSVVMGPLYRGAALPGLRGAALFTDVYDGGTIQALFQDPVSGAWSARTVATGSGQVFAHFATDAEGEVVALDLMGGAYRLEPAADAIVEPVPVRLSGTGCVDPADPRQPAAGLVPYEVVVPFWSDGLTKRRHVALPDGATARVAADGRLDLPPGTVLMKHFEDAGRPVETRLYLHHAETGWQGRTYVWNDDGTDAVWTPEGATVDREDGGPPWRVPAEVGCPACHTAAAGPPLGLDVAQLARRVTYDATGRTADQLATWEEIGLLDASPAFAAPLSSDDAPAEDAVRARLHVDCAPCHQPGGGAPGDLDLRVGTPWEATGLCDAPSQGDLGLVDARIVAPGDPARSVLLDRMARRDDAAMPPLGSTRVDEAAVAQLRAWIAALDPARCPP